MNDLPLFQQPTEQRKVFSVSEIATGIKRSLESEFTSIWVQGEISNCKPASSGHVYFSLKDEGATISVACFGWGRRTKGAFELRDGMQVLVRGMVTFYPPRGSTQMTVDLIEPLGAGALTLAFEQLKKKLESEGLFDALVKRKLPKYPKKIVVITSSQAAAFQDVLTVLKRRAPFVEVLLIHSLVQGEEAPQKLIQAIEVANRYQLGDVILLTRGGGSLEDLWAFNHEQLARTIRSSVLPIVSAVGHEIDFSISDFVADLRAPTPSAGAEILTEHWVELRERLSQSKVRLWNGIKRELQMAYRKLESIQSRLKGPKDRLRENQQRLDELSINLERLFRWLMERKRGQFEKLSFQLNALSPLQVLGRGYALARRSVDGAPLSTAEKARAEGQFQIQFQDGQVQVEVKV